MIKRDDIISQMNYVLSYNSYSLVNNLTQAILGQTVKQMFFCHRITVYNRRNPSITINHLKRRHKQKEPPQQLYQTIEQEYYLMLIVFTTNILNNDNKNS